MTHGVAVVGYGYWGPNLVRNFARRSDCAVRWVCDLDPARQAVAAREWPGVRTAAELGPALEDPAVELVAIATPIPHHFPLAQAALQADKHVLVEKPLAGSVAEAAALVELARARRRLLLVDHTYLFTPEVRYVRDMIRRGDLGELYYLDSVRINLGLFQRDHDVVWDLAPHDLSIFSCWLGRAPRSVLGVGSSHTPSGLADVALLHLDYGEQLSASVHVNWLSPVKVRRTLVAGRRRMVHYGELQPGERVQVYDCGIELPPSDLEGQRRVLVDYRKGDMLAPFIPAREALAIEAEEVVACLEGRAEPTSPGELGLEVVRVLEALSRSMAMGGVRVGLEEPC